MEFLKKFRSAKLIIFLATMVLFVLNAIFQVVPEEQLWKIIALVVAWLVSQGIADHGAQGAAKEARRAFKDGNDIYNIVRDVLGSTENKVAVGKPDADGDGPKELNG